MTTLSPAEQSYILTGLAHPTLPVRNDGRPQLTSFRPVQISQGDAPQANGSARVVLDARDGKRGGTEVVVGIKLEVVDCDQEQDVKGREAWRATVDVDVTPQAYPHAQPPTLSSLSSYYSNLLTDHVVPYLPPLAIIAPWKYFQPQIHVTISNTSSGSVEWTLVTAVRAALADLKVPKTRHVGYEQLVHGSSHEDQAGGASAAGGMVNSDLGLTGAVRSANPSTTKKGSSGPKRMVVTGKGRAEYARTGPGDDWDLDTEDTMEGEGERMLQHVRDGLPVCVTMHLIPETRRFFLDATRQEQLACPSRLHLFFSRSSAKEATNKDSLVLCGVRVQGIQEPLPLTDLAGYLVQGQEIAREMMNDLNKSMA